jgi:hypothetical protein
MPEVIMLHQGRSEATLTQFGIFWGNPNTSDGATGNFLGLQ